MNTKRIVVWIAGIILVLAITTVLFVFFIDEEQPGANIGTIPSVTLPVSGTAPGISVTVPSGSASSMVVVGDGGTQIITNNFIYNGVTILDSANEGRYLIAGDLGYCLTDPKQCRAGSMTNFNIFYDSTGSSFTIALLEEPLGLVRLEMEQSLMTTLGIAREDMCRLNYYVGTISSVSVLYDNKNLGFSFCPGAVVLPE